jgi:hypothetical protein
MEQDLFFNETILKCWPYVCVWLQDMKTKVSGYFPSA